MPSSFATGSTIASYSPPDCPYPDRLSPARGQCAAEHRPAAGVPVQYRGWVLMVSTKRCKELRRPVARRLLALGDVWTQSPRELKVPVQKQQMM